MPTGAWCGKRLLRRQTLAEDLDGGPHRGTVCTTGSSARLSLFPEALPPGARIAPLVEHGDDGHAALIAQDEVDGVREPPKERPTKVAPDIGKLKRYATNSRERVSELVEKPPAEPRLPPFVPLGCLLLRPPP